ncbi:MAG: ribosome biogenesis GTP-binding protein YihA/YsxC [Clostridia bacterium]|nr:ribosome biogenesis GTP-binding protein YihA/YsxC [Clostridia bacterium]
MIFNNAIFEASYGFLDQIPDSDLPEIVFSGRSNVGKSSAINKILKRKALARTSSTPGKTTTINTFLLNSFRLVDLPGYGYAKVSFSEKKRWAKLIEGYLKSDRDIRLIIQLIDMRHKATQNDMDMINFMCDMQLPFVILMTKSDKLNKTNRLKRLEEIKDEFSDFEGITVIPFSSVTGEGSDEIKEIIKSVI